MMIKRIGPGAQDYGCPAVEQIKMARAGVRGNDLQALIKRAGHQFADRMREVRLAPGEVPIHLIALGAYEKYGCNRNGDAFDAATCVKYHDTFVKHARFYRNHQNKDTAKSYGVVKMSAYNPTMARIELLVALNSTKEAADRNGGLVADKEMEKLARGEEDWGVSMACALPGTLVKVRKGFKKVEDVRAGDMVLTHRGRYRRVNASLKRRKQQYAVIDTKYCGRQALKFTPDHEFFVARWEDLPSARSLTDGGRSWLLKKTRRHELAAHARWLACGELKPGDFLLMPIPHGTGECTIAPGQARLLGYYIAEGSVTSDGYLCFTCNTEDAAVSEIPLMDGCEKHSVHPHSASDRAVNLTVYNKELRSVVAGVVGRGVRNKIIPDAILNATYEAKLEFLAGWFNGDGWQDGKGLHWSTCSRTLSIELQMLLASVGIPASVYRNDHTSDLPDRPRTGAGIEYAVNVSNKYSGVFAGRSKAEVRELRREKTTVFITGNYLAVPVKSVRVFEKEVEVYDLSVEEDESFTAYGAAVHNCRVPYDVCSGCKNQARNRSEYCTEATCKYGGCMNNLTKVADDGHVLCVYNPTPTWFDISDVHRPADRIAWVMGHMKAASGTVIGGAQMAEAYGMVLPPHLRYAAVDDRTARLIKIAYELADIETAFEAGLLGRTSDEMAVLEQPLLVPYGPGGPQIWNALAGEKIALSLHNWLRAIPERGTGVLTKQASVRDVAVSVPGVFSRMVADGDSLESHLADPTCDPSRAIASTGWRLWAHKQATDLSLAARYREPRRVARIVANGAYDPVPAREKTAAHDPRADALARQYAVYQIRLIDEWARDPELGRMKELLVRQNYLA